MPVLAVWDDTRSKPTQCRSCGAEITFLRLAKTGKLHPFDGRDPIYVKIESQGGRLLGYIDTNVSSSHFATCPQAASWKRKE